MIIRLFFVLLIILFSACSFSRFEEYRGQVIKIKYDGEIKEGDWIEIDGIKLAHKDINGFLTDPRHEGKDSVQKAMILAELERDLYLPTTRQRLYLKSLQQWKEVKISNNNMGYDLFTRFVSKLKQNGTELNTYIFKNDATILFNGEFVLRRRDGGKIIVRTSPGYEASIVIDSSTSK